MIRVRELLGEPWAAMTLMIAVGTVSAGLFQLAFPAVILGIIDGNDDNTAKHFFSIIGMFMALFGGLTIHALWVGPTQLVLMWAALQKLGASIAVGLGVVNDVFGPLALLVAGFDLLSFVVIGVLARRSP